MARKTAEEGPNKEEAPKRKKSRAKAASNGRSLVIVESPAKAKTINKILGKEFIVKACKGHVRDLPQRSFGIDVEHGFEPTYKPIKGKQDVLTELKEYTREADKVYLAPDPDREGEAIAWHLVQALRIPQEKVHRVTFNEITRRGVLEAFKKPGRISMDLVNAQQARRVLDRIVGYKLSPLLWKKVARGLSAGRVQSVAVRLIVEREAEIRAFKAVEYWTIEAQVSRRGDARVFSADLTKLDGKPAQVGTRADAEAVTTAAKSATWTVAAVNRKERMDHPPPPFITSSLQQQAANRLHYSAKRTMAIAQELYEGVDVGEEGGQVGLITYMRTDSFRVADEAVAEARAHIAKHFGPSYVPETPPAVRKAGKSAQEAHEAIRPTSPDRTPESIKAHLSPEQFKLYRLVWRRFIASQMRAAEYLTTEAELTAGRATFVARGRELKFEGYTKLLSPWLKRDEAEALLKEAGDLRTALTRIKSGGLRPTPDAAEVIRRRAASESLGAEDKTLLDQVLQSKDQLLPALEAGDAVDPKSVTPFQHFTEPPPRYTEASLVKALEKHGIGRPSTYAPIISTIQDRGYVEQADRRLRPTELGEIVTAKLVKHFDDIMNTGFTAEMEKKLDQIEAGEKPWVEVMEQFYGVFTGDLDRATVEMESVKGVEPETPVPCEKCSRPMLIKWNRFGKFLACSGYPECSNVKSLTPPELSNEKCDRCGSPMTVKSGRFGRFLACTKYPECKGTRPIPRGNRRLQPPEGWAEVCEKCGAKFVIRYGRRGPFIACSGYPGCTNTRRVPKEWFVEAKPAGAAAAPAEEPPEAESPDEGESES